ncbi:MAG: pantoate kinase [Candidatus Thorarchaeota archaeon]
MKEKAFSPGHITGFFQICDEAKDPLMKGSRGAGLSVSNGVTTTVEISPASKTEIHIEINGNASLPAPVSEGVISKYLELDPQNNREIFVTHEVNLPIGCGFGTSGAGALSLSLALNESLNLGLTRIRAAQIAHTVEVELRTGLGTVIAETVGGIEIRTFAGGPGVGQIETLPASNDYMVVCLPFGPISTAHYLKDEPTRQRINDRGGLLTDALRGHPTVENFLDYSRHFAEYIQIITSRVRTVLQKADEAGFKCSTAIFGENVFSLVRPERVKKLVTIFSKHKESEYDVLVMNVDWEGARVLNE